MFTRRTIAAAIAVLALSAGAPMIVLAHHGWGWTEEEESRLEGEIVSISFGNPHMHLQLRQRLSGFAQERLWEVDLAPPIVAMPSGFGPEHAASGDRAVLLGHRARDPEVLGFKAERIIVRGRTFDVYPFRDKTLPAQ